MSIRNVLMAVTSALLLIGVGMVAAIGTISIHRSVVREVQSRVDQDLSTLASLYQKDMNLTAERFRSAIDLMQLTADDGQRNARLLQARHQLDFAVLNFCGPQGEPLAGSYLDLAEHVPIDRDPILRAALLGGFTSGTVRLAPERLRLEGGPALATSQRVPRPEGATAGGTDAALFQWFALPVLEPSGAVAGLLYGGRPLNHDNRFVDLTADILFGEALYDGKPLGTVTIFLDGTRVATNVRDALGQRAVGTVVSKVVRDFVLQEGKRWTDRAWVVDAWYISGYEPLKDPDGNTLGMLYVGLLEAPYKGLRMRIMSRFAIPTALLLGASLAIVLLVVSRITRPLQRLQDAAGRIAAGDWDSEVTAGGAYRELNNLSDALHAMQNAIKQRDHDLRRNNEQLTQANDQLARANKNYMSMLGFVTHELKAPLANMQSMIHLLVDGYVCDIPQKGEETLTRIKRNCEELQDMVKNYLDLSRAERDDLMPQKRPIDFVADVVQPCLSQTEALFKSRNIGLTANHPATISMHADPELLRMALTNYLTNAAKYGRSGGKATLTVTPTEGDVLVEVDNEGAGFTPQDAEKLFKKFSRLDNKNTKSKKGSGLGLYLCAQVLAQHGGRVWAEAEAGQWAKFCFRFPAAPQT